MREHRAAARPVRRARACAARSSCSAGWPSAIPALVRADRRARPRGRVARLRASAGLRPDARRRSATTCGGPRRCSRTRAGAPVRGYRAPSYSITRAVALGARRPDRGRLPLRRQHLSDPPRSLRHSRCRRGIRTRIERDRRHAGRSAGVDGARRGRSNLPVAGGGYFRILPYAWTRWGIAPRQPGREASRRSSTCTRGRSIRISRGCRASALGRFRHYRNLHQTEARLRALLRDFALRAARRAVLAGCARMSAVDGAYVDAGGDRAPAVDRVAATCRAANSIATCDAHPGGDRLSSQRLARRHRARVRPRDAVPGRDAPTAASPACCRWSFFNSRLFGRFAVSMPFLNYGGVVADDAEARRGAAWTRADRRDRARAGGSHLELRHTRAAVPGPAAEAAQGGDAAGARAPTPDAPVGRARSQGAQPGPQGREERARRSSTAAPSCSTTSTPSSRATCATSARRSTRATFFARGAARRFPTPRACSSCVTTGRPVAASHRPLARPTIEVPWASALRESNPLCANVLLYWHMLKFAIERGFARVRLRPLDARTRARSTSSSSGAPSRSSWSGSTGTPPARRRPTSTPRTRSSSSPSGCGSGCRCRVATALGPHIVRNIP